MEEWELVEVEKQSIIVREDNGISYIIERLIAGPQGPPGASAGGALIEKTNDEVFSIQKGQPCRLNSLTGCVLATSTSFAGRILGVAASVAAAGAVTYIQANGLLEMEDWSNVTGTTTLVVGRDYYLGHIAGSLTLNPVDLPQHILQYVGIAISPTQLLVEISRPIIL